MKILHLDEQRTWRGGEQQASWLMQGLVSRGHAVAVAGRPGSPFVTGGHGGIEYERHEFPLRNEGDVFSAMGLARAARATGIEIIHAHSSHAHMLACLTRKFFPALKVVVSRRVSFPPKPNPITRWKYTLPDRLLAVSGEVKRVLLEYGLPERRVALVHSSVDLERLNVAAIGRADIGVPESVPLLVSAGALVGHKDHATLIEAFIRVRADYPDVHLAIAGEGELRPSLEALVANHDLGGVVHFLGHRTDAPAIIRAANVYVSSSWSEGLGTSVLEALACEVPVVAAVAGGIPEMVIEGETGYLVPNRDPRALADAIVASLRDPEQAKRMARNGRLRVQENFGVDRMVEGTLKVYREILENG